jgi:outer membrane lipoprotein-sorting protein
MNNPCEKIQDKIADYVIGVLRQEEIDALDKHISQCPRCSEYTESLQSEKRSLLQFGKTLDSEMDARQAKVIEALNQGSIKKAKLLSIWRTIMKTRITRIAAAAVIIIAVLTGLPFLGDNGTGIVLADVLEKVEQVRAFMYRTKMTTTGNLTTGMPSEEEIAVTVSNEYGMKWEVDMSYPNIGKKLTQQLHVLPDQKMVITIMPETKQYMRMELTDDWLARMKKQNNDPREMIKQIMNYEYIELGKSVIDGVEVEGFQTTDPTYFGGTVEEGTSTLWVDVETWLPVRFEVDFKMGEQTSVHSVTYDYQWDIPVNASEFQPIIPEDFTAFTGIKMPVNSEQAAIEGLRLFAEMSGRYPEKITPVGLG